jgi:predicted transcriptional regulator
MAELALEPFDRFSVMYDVISELTEKSQTGYELASKLGLSVGAVNQVVSFLLLEGFLKQGATGKDLRLTAQGFAFLQEFAGIRKFVG